MSEVDHKNMVAVFAYSKENRKKLDKMQLKIDHLEGLVLTLNGTVGNLQSQIGHLLVRLNTGGSTSDN